MNLFDLLPVPSWRAGLDAKCDYFNQAWLDFTGRTPAQELGDGWMAGVHPEDFSACVRDYREAFKSHAPFVLEYRLRRYDGEYRWLADHGAPFNDEAGKFGGYLGACYDITMRKEAEATLRRSERQFSAFMDNLPAFAWMKDPEGRLVYLNKMMRDLPEFNGEWFGKTDHDVWPAEIADQYRTNDQKVMGTRKAVRTVEPCLVDSETHHALVSKFPIFDQSGAIAMIGGAGVDITERIHAEDALRESEERFRELAENIDEVFWLGDLQPRRVLYISPAYEKIWGRTRASLYASPKSWTEALHPEDRERILAILAEGRLQAPAEMTYRIVRPDGSIRWIHSRGSPVKDASGKVVRVAGVDEDITERKEAEEAVRQANRQLRILSRRRGQVQEDERRRLARELHDQIGQLLTAGNINLKSARRTKDRRTINKKLGETIVILEQIMQQVRQISFDIRPPVLDDLGLAPAMRWMLDDSAARAGLTSEFFAAPNLRRADVESETACYRVGLEAVSNVVRHAQARKVWVELRNAGNDVQLVVRDDGIGFDAADAEKRVARDHLGLVGMRERVTAVGGQFECKSASGGGTEIHALFPISVEGVRAETL